MAFDQDSVNAQLALLAAHRRTLAVYLRQHAHLGVLAPPGVISGIAEAQSTIHRIKEQLRADGVPIEDEPNDAVQPVTSPAGILPASPPSFRSVLLVGVLAFLGAVLINIATSQLPPGLQPPLWLSWLMALLVTGASIWVAYRLGRSRESKVTFGGTLDQRNRSRMLSKVESFWIRGVLDQSLYQIARIELGLEYEPDAVAHPWENIVQRPNFENQPIPPGKPIIEVFDELGGELLILGAPGAGKTTLVLELARDLIARARKDEQQPIPVVFNLSTWAIRREPFGQWLIDELNQRYDVPMNQAREWTTTNALLILLDGLDEVAEEYRYACVDTINAYRLQQGFVSIVVCSRLEEYKLLERRLRLENAIVIQSLTTKQVDEYLKPKVFTRVRTVLHQDRILRELLDTPLMLSIMVLAYMERSPLKTKTKETLKERRQRLFNDYTSAMFERRGAAKYFSESRVVKFLSWLAKQMEDRDYILLRYSDIDFNWLPQPQKRVAISCGVLFVALELFGFIRIIHSGMIPEYRSILGDMFLGSMLFFILGAVIGVLRDKNESRSDTDDVFQITTLSIGLDVLDDFMPDGLIKDALLMAYISFYQYFDLFQALLRFVFLAVSTRTPWKFKRFLDYCVDRIFLRKVGGGYIFVHRLLMEHFASLYSEQTKDMKQG